MNNVNNVNLNDQSENLLVNGRTAAQAAKVQAMESKAADNVKSAGETGDKTSGRTDTVVKSGDMKPGETGIYSRESLLESLRAAEEQRIKAFEETIRSMMAQQGQTVNLTFRGLDLHVTEEQSAKAAASIADGGEYSVDAVAGRIMDMAKALSGGDPSKISMLRDAVKKGFGGAAEMLGRKESDMPQITKDTYAEVMKRFDDWENSYKQAEVQQTATNGAAIQAAAAQIATA